MKKNTFITKLENLKEIGLTIEDIKSVALYEIDKFKHDYISKLQMNKELGYKYTIPKQEVDKYNSLILFVNNN